MTDRPVVTIPSPDALTFAELFRIKAATGIDVLDPPTRGQALAACLWFATRDHDEPLTWAECMEYNLNGIEIGDAGDEELPPGGDDADPTHGSGTPSNES